MYAIYLFLHTNENRNNEHSLESFLLPSVSVKYPEYSLTSVLVNEDAWEDWGESETLSYYGPFP